MAPRKIDGHFLAPIVGGSMFGDPDRPDIFLFGDPKAPLVSRATLRRFVRGLPEVLGWGEEEYRAALVMLETLVICSRDERAVSRFAGVPLGAVRRYFARLAEHGIWRPDGSIQGHWVDPEIGMKVFWRDVLIATGKVGRVQREVVVMPGGEEPPRRRPLVAPAWKPVLDAKKRALAAELYRQETHGVALR